MILPARLNLGVGYLTVSTASWTQLWKILWVPCDSRIKMDCDKGLSERARARSDGAILHSIRNATNEEIKVTFLDNPNNINTTSPLLAETEVCLIEHVIVMWVCECLCIDCSCGIVEMLISCFFFCCCKILFYFLFDHCWSWSIFISDHFWVYCKKKILFNFESYNVIGCVCVCVWWRLGVYHYTRQEGWKLWKKKGGGGVNPKITRNWLEND